MPRRRWRFGRHSATIEQRTGILAIDREIDVLGDRPGPFDEAQSVKLGDHNSGHRAARVEKWAAAVSGLHGCRYLQLMRVVARPRQSADDPRETLACELSRPWSGKPTTTTASPGLIGLSPRASAESATGSGKRKIARSAVGSVAITVATIGAPLCSTRTWRQASTTWWLVRTSPARLTINPEPPELSRSPPGGRLSFAAVSPLLRRGPGLLGPRIPRRRVPLRPRGGRFFAQAGRDPTLLRRAKPDPAPDGRRCCTRCRRVADHAAPSAAMVEGCREIELRQRITARRGASKQVEGRVNCHDRSP